MEDRVRFIEYQGKSILLQDFSGMTYGPDFLEGIAHAKRIITSQPPKSVLTVFDASGGSFTPEVLAIMKEYTRSNTPYIKCATVVGIKGLLNVALFAVRNASRREVYAFPTREAALDFLVTR